MSDRLPTPDPVEITIIVPVFNVAPFIEGCLQSINLQSLKLPFEVILIDDCSTDESAAVCGEFISAHPQRFRLIKNSPNQGVSATRNRGLDEMTGRYFMFVDADDLLPPDALGLLYDAAQQSGASIVKGNNTIIHETSEKQARYNVSQISTVRGEAVLTTLFEHKKVRGHPWGKLFRRDQLGRYRFEAGIKMLEDLRYCSEVFANADSLLLLDKMVYRYRNRESGATGQKYASGDYLEWLDSVEVTARFAGSPKQLQAHKSLLIRTLAQLARESRGLEPALAQQVLPVIDERLNRWNLGLASLMLKDRLGILSISRYLKMLLAVRQTRRAILQRQN
jgi:CDP-glycerol glycerophosphotransferase